MQSKAILFVLVLSWLFSAQAVSQELRSQALSFAGGASLLARQDNIYSPFVHSDLSLMSFGLKFEREKKFYHYWEGGFSVNKAQVGEPARIDMGHHSHYVHPHEFVFIHLTWGAGKTIKETARDKARAGASLRFDLQAAFYSFVLSDMFGYFISPSANAWYKRTLSLPKGHQLSAQLEVPLVSWLARPPYLAEDDTFIENISSHNSARIIAAFLGDGQLTTWNKLQRANLHGEYRYPVSKGIRIGADYRFAFIRSAEPKPLISYQHQFHLITSINF